MAEMEKVDSVDLARQIAEMGPSYLKYVWMKPTQRRVSYIVAAIFTTLRITMVVLALVLIPTAENLMVIVNVIAGASAFGQGLKSTVPIVFYKDELLWLITQTAQFWPTDEDTRSIDSFYQKVLQVLILYRRLIVVTYTTLVPASLIFHKLPFATWIPPITGGFYVIFCLQFMMLTFDTALVYGGDSFFVGACLNIHAQFQILHHHLRNLGMQKPGRRTNIHKQVIECVKHHNFLLTYTNVLIRMYSIGLIIQFFVTTYSICIEIFIFTRRDTVGMIIGVIYCSMLTSQLALYCFPADAVIDISEQCADAIYSCPWYDNSKELKVFITSCIQRSYKRPRFSAGGLIEIDKRAFTKIFKGILSLNTLMKEMFE